MKMKDIEKFYYNDKKEYILSNRKGFENFLIAHYSETTNIEEMQELVDKLIAWYKIKMPDRKRNELDIRYKNIPDIGDIMTYEQLEYRYKTIEQFVMECPYKEHVYGSRINETEIKSKNGSIYVNTNGSVSYKTLKNYGLDFMSVEEFYNEFADKMDLSNLRAFLDKHKLDLILRNHIIDAVRKGLYYSAGANVELGKKRMEAFLNDVNSRYQNIDLANRMYDAKKYASMSIEPEEKKSFLKTLFTK